MARSKTINLEALARDGARALGRLGWIHPGDLPAKYERPEVFAMLLRGLAAELPAAAAQKPEFMMAKAAVDRWASAQRLADTAARLYHSPEIRAIAGSQATLDHYFQNPDEALGVLARHAAEFPAAYKSGALREAMQAVAEYQNFDVDHSSGGPEPTANNTVEQTPYSRQSVAADGAGPRSSPQPPVDRAAGRPGKAGGGGKAPTSYAELIAAKTLTPDQWAQLTSLAEARHPPAEEDDPSALLPDSYFGETKEEAER